MRTSMTKGIGLALLALFFCALQMQPALAVMSDRGVYAKLQLERNELLIKQNDLQHDYDELNIEIKQLERTNSDPSLLDHLQRKLDDKLADLKQVRFDLRAIDMRLL